ncbi:hypothetical protein QQS21_010845 [Conoideocrella luteorostrata]|uniref:Uncharacterized protein n=1 Tax=Conoideocrella luteorostrata TaxID=1105319 RepID=A0AAJ0CGZ9_9HYPO|nr:hypothetical protein QQS21_010845 [Conoideocrella luteorostrata]
MSSRAVYLAKYRSAQNQRAHFAVFIPNAEHSHRDLAQDFAAAKCQGTVIHAVGEPLMAGYTVDIKRNRDCSNVPDLRGLFRLGQVETANVYEPPPGIESADTARTTIEREALSVPAPPRGQDIRAPIDGVATKRCQEWTMEFLSKLEEKGLISSGAVSIAQSHRDPPSLGIFGFKNANKTIGSIE